MARSSCYLKTPGASYRGCGLLFFCGVGAGDEVTGAGVGDELGVGVGVAFFLGFFIAFGLIIAGVLTFATLESTGLTPLPLSAFALLPSRTTTSAKNTPAPMINAETRCLLATSCFPKFDIRKVRIESTISRHWIT